MYRCEAVGLEFLDRAPARFDSVVDVRATPQQIFDVFEDAHAWTVWAPMIRKVEWTSPKPFGVGTTRTVYLAGGMVGEEEFIAWETGRRMAFRFAAASRNQVRAFVEDYRVADLGNGRCRVTWRMALEPVGPGKLFMPVVAPVMRAVLQWMLGRFARYVEGHASAAKHAA